jgi:hypothetical protein
VIEHKIDVGVVGKKTNPIAVGPGKIVHLAIDREIQTTSTGKATGCGITVIPNWRDDY